MAYTEDSVTSIHSKVKAARDKLYYVLDYKDASEGARREVYRMLGEAYDMIEAAVRSARP